MSSTLSFLLFLFCCLFHTSSSSMLRSHSWRILASEGRYCLVVHLRSSLGDLLICISLSFSLSLSLSLSVYVCVGTRYGFSVVEILGRHRCGYVSVVLHGEYEIAQTSPYLWDTTWRRPVWNLPMSLKVQAQIPCNKIKKKGKIERMPLPKIYFQRWIYFLWNIIPRLLHLKYNVMINYFV